MRKISGKMNKSKTDNEFNDDILSFIGESVVSDWFIHFSTYFSPPPYIYIYIYISLSTF